MLAKLALNNLRRALQNNGALHDEIHILRTPHAVNLSVHQMQGNRGNLALGQPDTQSLPHERDAAASQFNLARIHKGDLMRKRVLNHNPIIYAFDGTLQMIGKTHHEVARERAIEGLRRHGDDIGGCDQNIIGDIGKTTDASLIDIAKHPLDDRFILQFIGHLVEPHALTKDNNLLAGIRRRQGDIVVDLLENEHKKLLGTPLRANGTARPPMSVRK